MGLFSKIFKSKKDTDITENVSFNVPECNELLKLRAYIDSLLSSNRYIAKVNIEITCSMQRKPSSFWGAQKQQYARYFLQKQWNQF